MSSYRREKSSRKELIRGLVNDAIATSNPEPLKFLIEHEKIDPNKYPKGSTFLHFAIKTGQLDFLLYLLELPQVNPDKPDENGDTPLLSAIKYEKYDLIPHLLPPQTPSKSAKCPYHRLTEQVKAAKRVDSSTKRSIEFLRMFQTRGFPFPCKCKVSQPIVHSLLLRQNAYVLEAFLEAGAAVNELNKEGENAVFVAAQLKHFPTIRCLIMHGGFTWDSEGQSIDQNPGLTQGVKMYIKQICKRRAVFYILKFRNAGAPLFSALSFWLIKEIIAFI